MNSLAIYVVRQHSRWNGGRSKNVPHIQNRSCPSLPSSEDLVAVVSASCCFTDRFFMSCNWARLHGDFQKWTDLFSHPSSWEQLWMNNFVKRTLINKDEIYICINISAKHTNGIQRVFRVLWDIGIWSANHLFSSVNVYPPLSLARWIAAVLPESPYLTGRATRNTTALRVMIHLPHSMFLVDFDGIRC